MSNATKPQRQPVALGDQRAELAREIFIRKVVASENLGKTPEHIAELSFDAADAFLAVAQEQGV